MTPPNYFRFVKKDDEGGGGGGLPNQEYQKVMSNATGLTMQFRTGGSRSQSAGEAQVVYSTDTINSVANVATARFSAADFYYWTVDDQTAVNTTFASNAYTVAFWWYQDDGNYYTRRFGLPTPSSGTPLRVHSSGTRVMMTGPWGTYDSYQTNRSINPSSERQSATLTTGAWQHYAFAVNKSAKTFQLFLDGTEVFSKSGTDTNDPITTADMNNLNHDSGDPLSIWWNDHETTMTGRMGPNDMIADFRLFSADLDASGISDLMDDVS